MKRLISLAALIAVALSAQSAFAQSATEHGDRHDFNAGIETKTVAFPVASYEAVAGAGTTVSDAAELSASKQIFRLTGANGTVGWKFATSVGGEFRILLNTTAGVAKIYAASGGTVNGGSADAAFSALTGIKPILCFSTAADTWICS